MSAFRVEFIEVGLNKRSWVADTSGVAKDDLDQDGFPSAEWLAREAKQGGQLMSNDVDVVGDFPDMTVLVGGSRPVGRCRVEAVTA